MGILYSSIVKICRVKVDAINFIAWTWGFLLKRLFNFLFAEHYSDADSIMIYDLMTSSGDIRVSSKSSINRCSGCKSLVASMCRIQLQMHATFRRLISHKSSLHDHLPRKPQKISYMQPIACPLIHRCPRTSLFLATYQDPCVPGFFSNYI